MHARDFLFMEPGEICLFIIVSRVVYETMIYNFESRELCWITIFSFIINQFWFQFLFE